MISLATQTRWLKRCHLILASVTLCGIGSFYLFAYRPVTRHIHELASNIKATDAIIRTNEEAARDLDRIKIDVERLRDQLTRSRQLPPHPDLPRFIRDVTQLSQVAGLQRFSCSPEEKRKQQLCEELPIKLQFTGTFNAVATFLREAEYMPRLIRTRDMTLKSSSLRGDAALVEVSLTMSVFYSDEQ